MPHESRPTVPGPRKNDADRIFQMEEDLYALHWHISNMEEQLCVIMTRLQTAKLAPPETGLTHPGGPS